MSNTDAFALGNSRLNSFLFAEVGTELNGSSLTLLSVLARLGKDPWAEAAYMATMPKEAIVDSIVSSLSLMPLDPRALLDARLTAARLVMLLPKHRPNELAPVKSSASKTHANWFTLAMLGGALALGLAANSLWVQHAAAPAPPHSAGTEGQ